MNLIYAVLLLASPTAPATDSAVVARRVAASAQLAAQEYRIGVVGGKIVAAAEVEEARLFLNEAIRVNVPYLGIRLPCGYLSVPLRLLGLQLPFPLLHLCFERRVCDPRCARSCAQKSRSSQGAPQKAVLEALSFPNEKRPPSGGFFVSINTGSVGDTRW